MPPKPQALNSSSVNPANLVELQVLTKVITQLQNNGDIRGSIPYLAKVVQIVDNQKLDKPDPETLKTDNYQRQKYHKQLNELRKVKADAYANLADAYFHTQQFVVCETSLLISVKIWEKLKQYEPNEIEASNAHLKAAYQQLLEAYEAMNKPHMAQHMANKLSKLDN